MRPSYVNKKRDANEPAIIAALRAVGATVLQLSEPDAPDLLVGFRRANFLFEVKSGNGKLREGQRAWANAWMGGYVWVVRDAETTLAILGVTATRSST